METVDSSRLRREQPIPQFGNGQSSQVPDPQTPHERRPSPARAGDLDEIERLQEEALAVKNQIVRSNLRLVVSIAKRHCSC